MNPEITTYLKSQRVGVISVLMPDGKPHGATVHFAYSEEPFTFYFQTFNASRKAQSFINGQKSGASFVIGVDESTMQTMQLDGDVELISPEEKEACEAIYLGKFPEKSERAKDPKAVYFKFTPTWWRFSDLKRPEGKLILTSN
jgi:uncharacterized protein YhbP (UPF0306 family)